MSPGQRRRYGYVGLIRWLAAWAVWLLPQVALAQPNPDPSKAEMSAADLRAKVAELERQLADERANADADAQARKQELEALQFERSRLGGEVLDAATTEQQHRRRLEELAEREQALLRQKEAIAEPAAAVRQAAAALAERVDLYLAEIPHGADASADGVVAAFEAIDRNPAQATAAVASLVQLLDRLHDAGTRIDVRSAELMTAGGRRQTVKLLSAGHVAFAYQGPDGEVAIALNSPADASGYRWVTQLSDDNRQQIVSAMQAASSGTIDGAIMIPMDPTQKMRAESVEPPATVGSLFAAGGPIMWPLLLVAVLAAVLLIERFIYLARQGGGSTAARDVIAAVNQRDLSEAEQTARGRSGVVARTLAACLARRTGGPHAMEDAVQEQLLHELPRLNRFMALISLLAAVSPLLGLLGTVTGIMQIFGVIRLFGNANPGLMAGGISEALITTATGLAIAIPILLLHNLLSGRVDKIVSDAEKHAATLLNSVQFAEAEATA